LQLRLSLQLQLQLLLLVILSEAKNPRILPVSPNMPAGSQSVQSIFAKASSAQR
jgi:hypothetical protein